MNTTAKTAKTSAARRTDGAELIALWPHIIAGTLRFDNSAHKQTVKINTFGLAGELDGGTRRIYTSDLFQTYHTLDVKAERDGLTKEERSKVMGAVAKSMRAMRKSAKSAKAGKGLPA